MGDFCFSIDEERYDDRHGHVLSLDGWYSHPDRKTYGFELLGDGYDTVELPEIQRRERPDVAQALGCEFGDFLPGFTVQIPEVLKLAEKYQSLELFLRDGEERVSIWEISADELDELIKENLVEYHLDRVEILYDTMLEIQGWVVDQRGSVEVTVHQEDASLLDCRISRGRRPDVVERRNLDEEYKTQEIGFRISAALPEIKGGEIILHFCGDSVTKTYTIDIEELRKQNKPKGFLSRLFGKESVAEGGYEAWLARHKVDKRTLRRQKHAAFAQKPLISIVIPLYCTPLPYLKELLESVRRQSYENWQLCLADGSPDDKVKNSLRSITAERNVLFTASWKRMAGSPSTQMRRSRWQQASILCSAITMTPWNRMLSMRSSKRSTIQVPMCFIPMRIRSAWTAGITLTRISNLTLTCSV